MKVPAPDQRAQEKARVVRRWQVQGRFSREFPLSFTEYTFALLRGENGCSLNDCPAHHTASRAIDRHQYYSRRNPLDDGVYDVAIEAHRALAVSQQSNLIRSGPLERNIARGRNHDERAGHGRAQAGKIDVNHSHFAAMNGLISLGSP
jgi:hypothetical protein